MENLAAHKPANADVFLSDRGQDLVHIPSSVVLTYIEVNYTKHLNQSIERHVEDVRQKSRPAVRSTAYKKNKGGRIIFLSTFGTPNSDFACQKRSH